MKLIRRCAMKKRSKITVKVDKAFIQRVEENQKPITRAVVKAMTPLMLFNQQPLFLCRPAPTSPFCAGVQFSLGSIRAFNDQIKIGENSPRGM